MELSGIVLGVTVALLWGSTDSISAFAVRSIGAMRTTFFSQLAGLVIVAILSLFFSRVWDTFTPLVILLGAGSGLISVIAYYVFYRGLTVGPVTLVSTISSGSSIVTLLLAFLVLKEQLTSGDLLALGIIFFGVIQASTDLRAIVSMLSPKSFSSVHRSSGVKWALLTLFAFGAMDFSIGLSAKISGWFLPVLFMRCFSLLFLSAIQLWTHYQTQVKNHSGTHFPVFQAKDVPMSFSREKRTVLRAENILGDATIILPSRKQRNTQMGALSGMPTMIKSMEKLQNLRQAPLIDITNKLLPPVVLLPTRSVIGVLSRMTSTTSLQSATTLVLPSTIIVFSDKARRRGVLLAVADGTLESIAVLLFSLATQVTSTGITSVLANGYAVVSLLIGLIIFRERLNVRQVAGVVLILSGICLLAFSPI